ncbi:MAG: TonB-dependent receptor [Desulfobacteraceae bacterium]|nr:TonB-dependent receptor [Desulfobacteraceae bacterium]
MKKAYPVAFLFFLACMQAAPGHSADLSPQTPAMMDEIVVTASRSAEFRKEISANLTVVDREEIEQSCSRNAGDLLAEKGIGHIKRYPGNLTTIGIRGYRNDTHGNDLQGHVLVLLDGRRAGTGNVAKLLTKNIEKIEIIRGPGAVQYGSAGMGGVINIITRQAETKGMFLEAGGGSFDTWERSIGGTFKENGFDFAGSYTHLTYDDYDTGGGDTYDNTGIDYETGISANLGYSFSENHRLGVTFTRFDAEEPGSPSYFSKPDLDDVTNKDYYSIDTSYTGATENEQYQWMARYFFGKDENEWIDNTGSDPSGLDDGIPSANETDQQGLQAQVTGAYDFATMTVGFDWLDCEVKNTWTPEETTYSNPALFFMGKSPLLGEDLTVNLGLRYDWYDVEVTEPAGGDESRNNFTPQIGFAWMVTDELKIRGQYAEAFMMPSAKQLSADYPGFTGQVVGNPDLDPENSSTYEAGIDYFHKSLKASLTYFHSDFEDKIVTDYQSNGDQSWTNLGDTTIAGFEVEFSYDLAECFNWAWEMRPYLGMTILTEYKDEQTGENLLYTSGTNLAAGLVVSNGAGPFVRLNIAYTGKQDVMDYESGWPYSEVELASSTVTDLVAAYRFYESPDYGAFTIRGEIRNLFDQKYAYAKGYPMPGINWFLGLRWEY